MPLGRAEFSRSTKVRAFERANGLCENCGAKLTVGKVEYDHQIPDALTGVNSLENCAVLCRGCHKAKTRGDVRRIAKAKRQHARHIGAEPPKQKLNGRGFWKRKKRRRIQLPNELPPTPLMQAGMESEG